MWLDYFSTNCVKSPKFSKVIFKKLDLKVYANCVQCNLTLCCYTAVFDLVLSKEIIAHFGKE